MPSLSMWFLGGFRVCLDGEPVAALQYDKVRAALAYLVLESGQPHRREALAGLLWPELSERRARRNLSQALYVLHSALDVTGRPFLLITPQTVQFDLTCDHWLDVHALAQERGRAREVEGTLRELLVELEKPPS